jgi:hypothetical protein
MNRFLLKIKRIKIMKTNKVMGAESDTGPTVRKSINLKESPGVYDRNPDPGLSNYPRSIGGPNEIPQKFAESVPSLSRKNPITSAVEERNGRIAPKSTTDKINAKPNRYDSVKNKAGY